jgi:hypothetical protein
MDQFNFYSSLSTDAFRILFWTKPCLNWKIGLIVAVAQEKGWGCEAISLLHEAAMQVSSKKANFGIFEHRNVLPSTCTWAKEDWVRSGWEMRLKLVRDRFEHLGGDTRRFDSDIKFIN